MKKKSKTYRVIFRRKREGRTNYKKRLNILISNKLRLVVRKSLKNIQANIIDYDSKGDKVVLSVHSRELEKLGWRFNKGNVPAAYLTGLLLGKKVKTSGLNELVMDIGLNASVRGSRIYAVLAGILDSGIELPHKQEILPSKERIVGKHISDFASKIKEKGNFEKQFSGYIKNNLNTEDIIKNFEDVKSEIIGGEHGKGK